MGCLLSAPLAEDGDECRPGGGAGGGGRGGGGRRARARRGGAQDAAPLGELDLAPPHWTAPASSKLRKPSDLAAARDEFWDTAPAYGGGEEIWLALRSASELARGNDLDMAEAIVGSAGIIAGKRGLAECYDELGRKYELPEYVLSDPDNLLG